MAFGTERFSSSFLKKTSRYVVGVLRLIRVVIVRQGRFMSLVSGRLLKYYTFPSMAWRIIFLNLLGLVILIMGNLYLNQFRAGLTEAKVKSLETQGRIIAAAVAGSATVKSNSVVISSDDLLELRSNSSSSHEDDLGLLAFTIDPEQVAPVLYHLVPPTGTRARLYDKEAELIIDTMSSTDPDLISFAPTAEDVGHQDWSVAATWQRMVSWVLYRDLPVYEEIGNQNGKFYPEVETALAGIVTPIVRVNEKGELVISIGVPVQRGGSVRGVLLLSAQGGDIEAILRNESYSIGMFGLVAFGVTALLSVLLAQQIAGPVRRLSAAAAKVGKSIKARKEIPDFTNRSDEIGDLSGALRDMTASLYRHLDSTESFAADVAHELKNPLTSLQSAAETLTIISKDEKVQKLADIIHQDAGRLDRLITDISEASRLDAELALTDAEEIDLETLVRSICRHFNDVHMRNSNEVTFHVGRCPSGKAGYWMMGHESRLGQVFNNILDNALSFSPEGGKVAVSIEHLGDELSVTIDDEGPGIEPEQLERVFIRFYTDRPGEDNFGRNSGLGLNISRQIIEAHGGRIWAENRGDADEVDGSSSSKEASTSFIVSEKKPERLGARFVIRVPAM